MAVLAEYGVKPSRSHEKLFSTPNSLEKTGSTEVGAMDVAPKRVGPAPAASRVPTSAPAPKAAAEPAANSEEEVETTAARFVQSRLAVATPAVHAGRNRVSEETISSGDVTER